MLEKTLYMNLAAIPIYVIIWVTTVFRKMTKGRTNVLFLWLTGTAFLTVFAELFVRYTMRTFPLTPSQVQVVKAAEYVYFLARNASNLIYIFFIFSVTRTWYKIRPLWKKLLIALPFIAVCVMLLINERTGYVFTVTAERGYDRGRKILILYLLATIYFVFGTLYVTFKRHLLDLGEWVVMITMYASNLIAVLIQLFYPGMLIECYFTSISILFIVLFVQRPEKQVDMNTGLPGYRAFCEEMRKIEATGQSVQLIIVSLTNASEVRRFLGDEDYFEYIHSIDENIRVYADKEKKPYELYFEEPGCIYIITDDPKYNPAQAIPDIRRKVRKGSGKIAARGALPDTRIVSVKFPDDIKDAGEFFRFGHSFTRFANVDKVYTRAADIIGLREYRIEAHMGEILDRALGGQKLEIKYKPVWSVKEGRYVSAEAVIRLDDEEFGEMDEVMLSEAAERRGMIIRLGAYVLDRVFAFVGSEEFELCSYSCVDIPVSVTQCMQMDFTDLVWRLREKYDVHPEKICLCIRELSYENMSAVMNENLNKLASQGYGLCLDGYGNGFSNIQHILKLPLRSVRFDKSMIAAAMTDAGRAVLEGSIKMLKSIPLEVICCGADDKATAEMLESMGCELLQGELYS
ncbi:MAG: EAL domain-containing protein [Lachnospiraceae bacterium]|nr:EAL domain-containing protein [Lachnospiraceae bacterium]